LEEQGLARQNFTGHKMKAKKIVDAQSIVHLSSLQHWKGGDQTKYEFLSQ
jgi:hypothetical protein